MALRIIPIKNAAAAAKYYSRSDGYYAVTDDLHREWGGKGAVLLGLFGRPEYDQFMRLMDGNHPLTGKKLSSGTKDASSLAGWDINVHCPKGVTIAIEWGDRRVHDALWEAGRESMADVEAEAATRVRKGGQQDDRLTGNMAWYAVEHPETRPLKEDGMPDPHRHIHFCVANATYDPVEGEWKALKVHEIMRLRKYFDRRFEMRFAAKLAALGYEIETKRKDGKYVGWDIKGIPASVVQKFSRRSGEIDKIAADLGITSPKALDKLGATSRQYKRKDLTLEDYRKYWQGRVTPAEHAAIAGTMQAARGRDHLRDLTNMVGPAMRYAVLHEFERASVLPWEKLAITAMERSMGAGLPDEVKPEALRQGVLFKDGQVTTPEVLAEESRMIRFAVAGRGSCRALGSERGRAVESARPLNSDINLNSDMNSLSGLQLHKTLPGFGLGQSLPNLPNQVSTLSPEQQAAIDHVLTSPDRIMLLRGIAGTGKTTLAAEAFRRIGVPVIKLAPTTPARDVMRQDFKDAETLQQFLVNKKLQVRDSVIWLDEASLAGTRSIAALFELAGQLNARVVLAGDKRQMPSVERGSPLGVLETIAKLPVAEVTEIRRQKGEYREAVKLLAAGKTGDGLARLDSMGWVKLLPVWDQYEPVAKQYAEYIKRGETALIVCPTHAEGDKVTEAVRAELKK